MGVIEESASQAVAELTCTRPKERQFQVVHVPGVFTRGRWKCWDYRDETAATVTTKDSDNPGVESPSVHSPTREESSTILVTSIAPAPATPQHGTPNFADLTPPPYTPTEEEFPSSQPSASPASSSVAPEQGNDVPVAEDRSASVVANKIEQAMDLVKTHLTFAVREEVVLLRTTITELEQKVAQLEQQNAYLRRFVSPEVLQNLPTLVLQHKQSVPQTSAPDAASLAASERQPSPINYCPATSNFASTLNTVVPQPPR